jgi:hypothetical protein
MRNVELSRFVAATPAELDTLLTPRRLVEYEGSFSVDAVEETDTGTVITASGPGLRFQLRFEQRADGYYYYEQAGEAGPFEAMETTVSVDRKNEGSQVTMTSQVALSLSIPFADRIAGWKRRGELERALDALAADC